MFETLVLVGAGAVFVGAGWWLSRTTDGLDDAPDEATGKPDRAGPTTAEEVPSPPGGEVWHEDTLDTDAWSAEDAVDALADATEVEVADSYERTVNHMRHSRGEPVDHPTALLVAGARSGRELAELQAWAETTGLADPTDLARLASRLAEAGVLTVEDGQLGLGEVVEAADPDPDQLVSAVTSAV
jgi:hypothetical protein